MGFTKEELENEIWLPIENYENLYEISDLGRVKSLRTSIQNRGGFFRERLQKIMKICKDEDGYSLVSLSKDKVSKTKKVHRLVGKAFIPNPKNLPTINHKDAIKDNNRKNNLEWDSYRDNNIKKWYTVKSSSSFTGVCWKKSNLNWTAHISIDGKQRHLGSFTKEECASLMYIKAYENLDKYNGDLLKFKNKLIEEIFEIRPDFSIIKRK